MVAKATFSLQNSTAFVSLFLEDEEEEKMINNRNIF
jgi:hypothetical protein